MTPTPTTNNADLTGTVQLAPSYALPIALVVIAMPIVWLQPWVAAVVALFGLFLLFQTVTLRLLLTETAFDLYRGETLLRRFPYQDWQNWRIFWPQLPILLYFREVKSIHFLPILFDARALKACLERRCPRI